MFTPDFLALTPVTQAQSELWSSVSYALLGLGLGLVSVGFFVQEQVNILVLIGLSLAYTGYFLI